MLLLLHFMLSACVIESLLSQNSLRGPTSYITNNLITLQNEYVKLVFDQEVGSIISLSSDFHGNSDFGVNLLSDPFKLDIFTTSTDTLAVQKKNYNTNPKHKSELERKNKDDKPNADQLIMEAQTSNDLYVQNWVITLSSNSRAIDIQVSGKLLQLIQSVNHASYSFSLITPSLYGLFADSGVVQMMNQNSSCLGSRDELSRAYFIGNGGALDIVFNHDTQTNSTDIVQERVFHSYSQLSDPGIAKSGLEFVVGGKYPLVDNNFNSAWSDSCWNNAQTADLPANLTWSLSFTLMPNNYNFPVYALSSASASATNLPFTDLSTFLMGLYASPAGCLQSYYKNQKGIIAPTISHPDVGYSPDSNFFDPDNFISLSALMYSGDDYFLRQSRDVIERTAETMCGIGTDQDKEYCDQNRQRLFHSYYTIQRHTELAITDPMMSGNARAGQLMHHFIDLQPTYESIAGSEQLGPNIFWTLSVLRYASLTQDKTWAEKMFPYVDLSTKFILSFIDTSNFLVNAPGPLWIDVLVRENYTSDSGAMIVPVLEQLAEFYMYVSDDKVTATELRLVAEKVTASVNQYLWADSGDHLVTQLNADKKTTRDFVDYDSNLIAVAFGVISDANVSAVLNRVDRGPYTHVRATWCSEMPYTGDAPDCYIVGGSVCGDSVVTLARIGWVDSLARKRVKDAATIRNVLLAPLQKDLLANTWLNERYDSSGSQVRTDYYFEYPSLITIMLREVVYGINIGLTTVSISPLLLDEIPSFTYQIGNIFVQFNPAYVALSLPGYATQAQAKTCTIHSLNKRTLYKVSNSCYKSDNLTVLSDESGSVKFETTFSSGCMVTIQVVK